MQTCVFPQPASPYNSVNIPVYIPPLINFNVYFKISSKIGIIDRCSNLLSISINYYKFILIINFFYLCTLSRLYELYIPFYIIYNLRVYSIPLTFKLKY